MMTIAATASKYVQNLYAVVRQQRALEGGTFVWLDSNTDTFGKFKHTSHHVSNLFCELSVTSPGRQCCVVTAGARTKIPKQ